MRKCPDPHAGSSSRTSSAPNVSIAGVSVRSRMNARTKSGRLAEREAVLHDRVELLVQVAHQLALEPLLGEAPVGARVGVAMAPEGDERARQLVRRQRHLGRLRAEQLRQAAAERWRGPGRSSAGTPSPRGSALAARRAAAPPGPAAAPAPAARGPRARGRKPT